MFRFGINALSSKIKSTKEVVAKLHKFRPIYYLSNKDFSEREFIKTGIFPKQAKAPQFFWRGAFTQIEMLLINILRDARVDELKFTRRALKGCV